MLSLDKKEAEDAKSEGGDSLRAEPDSPVSQHGA